MGFAPLAGNFYGEWPVKTYVARTNAEWEAVWLEHNPLQSPVPSMPSVDFQTNSVLGVSLGWGNCESVSISRVAREGNTHWVEYRRSTLQPGAGCAAVQSPLITFVLVPAPVEEAIFMKID